MTQAEAQTLKLKTAALESADLGDELLGKLLSELPPEKERAAAQVSQELVDGLETLTRQAVALATSRKLEGTGTVTLHMLDRAPAMVSVDGGGVVMAQNLCPMTRATWLEQRAARLKAGSKKVVSPGPAKAAPAPSVAAPSASPAAAGVSALRGPAGRSRLAPTQPAPAQRVAAAPSVDEPPAAADRPSRSPTPAMPLPAAAQSRLAESEKETPRPKGKGKPSSDD